MSVLLQSMALKIIETADGSTSFYNEDLDETYHSRHGAIQEAEHVFIKMGLEQMMKEKNSLTILEMGLGTGLNALLSALKANEASYAIDYIGLEAFPLGLKELDSVNFPDLINDKNALVFLEKIHEANWEDECEIHPFFKIKKVEGLFEEVDLENEVDLIYFDAFGPRVQPALWTEAIFKRMFNALKTGGLLTTYCAQGNARRAMIASGFDVQKVAGPPGKREMLIARKNG